MASFTFTHLMTPVATATKFETKSIITRLVKEIPPSLVGGFRSRATK